jgi:hypothetical protein
MVAVPETGFRPRQRSTDAPTAQRTLTGEAPLSSDWQHDPEADSCSQQPCPQHVGACCPPPEQQQQVPRRCSSLGQPQVPPWQARDEPPL